MQNVHHVLKNSRLIYGKQRHPSELIYRLVDNESLHTCSEFNPRRDAHGHIFECFRQLTTREIFVDHMLKDAKENSLNIERLTSVNELSIFENGMKIFHSASAIVSEYRTRKCTLDLSE